MSNFQYLIFGLINLLILIFLLVALLKRQFINFLDMRQKRIFQAIKNTQEKYELAKKNLKKAELNIEQVEKDASKIRRALVEMGSYSYDATVVKSHEIAERLQKETTNLMLQELSKTERSIKQQALDLAFTKAKLVLQQGVSQNKQEELLVDSFEQLAKIKET
ncbi:MAG: hypothetical protein ABH859_05365 [Pseudomonadota bacterium]